MASTDLANSVCSGPAARQPPGAADAPAASDRSQPRADSPMAGDVLAFAAQGEKHGDEARLFELLGQIERCRRFPFDRAAKRRSAWRLLKQIVTRRLRLVLMEGTGVGGG